MNTAQREKIKAKKFKRRPLQHFIFQLTNLPNMLECYIKLSGMLARDKHSSLLVKNVKCIRSVYHNTFMAIINDVLYLARVFDFVSHYRPNLILLGKAGAQTSEALYRLF